MIKWARDRFSSMIGPSGRRATSYDALVNHEERRPIQRQVFKPDEVLNNKRRQYAIATAQDLHRNFATASWAVRKSADFISSVKFQAATDSDDLNFQLSEFMSWWGHRTNCDARQLLSLRQLIRLAEIRRTVDGDIGMLKIGGQGRDRGRLQPIEGYRVRNPSAISSERDSSEDLLDGWHNGFQVNANGSVRRYSIWTKSITGTWEFERFVPVQSMNWLKYQERFEQYRGISPLMSALNSFQDVYEGIHWNLGKMKAASSVAMAIFRDSIDDDISRSRIQSFIDNNKDGVGDGGYSVDMLPGVNKLELLPGDRVESFDSRTPPTETVEFMKFVLSICMKALDLPDTFLREQDGNFFSNRAAWNSYKRTAQPKIDDLIEWLDDLTRWRLGMAVADGDIILPAGMDFSDLQWEWIHVGMPWGNKDQEARGDLTAIAGGLDNPQRIAKEHGLDFYHNVDETVKALQYAQQASADAGVNFNLATDPNFSDDAQTEFPQTEETNDKQ